MTSGQLSTVAIVDDEADIRSALRQMLQLERLNPVEFADAESALAQIDASFPGIVIADLRMPGLDGSGLFNRIQRCDPELPVIMISGHGDIATAVDLVQRGAYDFLSKPFDSDSLIASVRRALEKRALVLENRSLRARPVAAASGAILGESPEIEKLRHMLTQLAQADIDVLISGESGVGKSLIAETLHRRSPRARKAMVTIDCSALPSEQAESLLFGHVSGAFAGAQFPRSGQMLIADGSTLVLDHVDGLPRTLQARIQQTMETRAVLPVGGNQPQASNFRTISATDADLDRMVEAGEFDRSLYFRLGAFRLEVPPLRDRRGDVIVLFRAFLIEAAAELKRDPPRLSPSIWKRLQNYDWPGNVRELRSFAANVALGLGDLDSAKRPISPSKGERGLKEAIAAFEADMIRDVLDRCSGDIAASIAALQLPRKTFYDKLARHAIDPNDYRQIRGRRGNSLSS
jgi:two-component system, NtrC family, C4-dicarboxylate transport response regulator DctD